jgi:site-specific recombinase XerD
MRVSELVGIDRNDVDKYFRSLTVTGKGNKQRIVYLNEACREALASYASERGGQKYEKADPKPLFLSSRGQRISVKTVQWMVYKYLDLAGLESKHYSVHKLRHTAATLMYQTGNVDVRVLKDILGHEQLNTTQIYTHVSNRSMEEAMAQNPLASQKSTGDTSEKTSDSEKE